MAGLSADIKNLIARLPEEKQLDLKILANVALSAKKACAAKPTNANRKAWKEADEALAEECTRLEGELRKKAVEQDEGSLPEHLSSVRAVADYLRGRGYKVGKSTIANHVKVGLLKRQAGKFARNSVDRYAQVNIVSADTGLVATEEKNVKLQERKLKAEIKLKEEHLRKAIRENEILEGKYISRIDHEREIAAACGVLESALKYFYRTSAPEIVDLVGGDQAKAADLQRWLISRLDIELNRFAKTAKIEVEIVG